MYFAVNPNQAGEETKLGSPSTVGDGTTGRREKSKPATEADKALHKNGEQPQ
jgi:hypothetical protein